MLLTYEMQSVHENRRAWVALLRRRYKTLSALNVALGRNHLDATFSQILNRATDSRRGKVREMGERLAREIEDKLGLELGALDRPPPAAEGADLPWRAIESNAVDAGAYLLNGRIPVRGRAKLGDNGHFAEVEAEAGTEGYLPLQSRDPQAYALRCTGDSMEPRIRHGEFVMVEPSFQAQPGDEVLVVTRDGRVMVKIYLYRRDGRIHLASVNQKHGIIAIDEAEALRLHPIGAIAKKMILVED